MWEYFFVADTSPAGKADAGTPLPQGPDSSQTVHRRRPRYRGTHPRNFREKYKELNPGQHPDLVAKLRAKGKTPAGTHLPILVDEVLEVLKPVPGSVVVDVTLGHGGHSSRLLSKIQPGGVLIALDADPIEFPKAKARLEAMEQARGVRLGFHRSNYAGLGRVLGEENLSGADAILADLGLSSMQIDDPERGFSWKHEGPLDMRMNPTHGRPASEWLAQAGVAEMAEWFENHSDEPHARYLAEAIAGARKNRPILTTRGLAGVVDAALSKAHPGGPPLATEARELSIRRVFQALRIAVNDEFGSLDHFLRQLPGCLNPGGRVAVLTFHSGEDRRVKHAFANGLAAGVYAEIADEVIRPKPEEIERNVRARPAKLRWAVRQGAGN